MEYWKESDLPQANSNPWRKCPWFRMSSSFLSVLLNEDSYITQKDLCSLQVKPFLLKENGLCLSPRGLSHPAWSAAVSAHMQTRYLSWRGFTLGQKRKMNRQNALTDGQRYTYVQFPVSESFTQTRERVAISVAASRRNRTPALDNWKD